MKQPKKPYTFDNVCYALQPETVQYCAKCGLRVLDNEDQVLFFNKKRRPGVSMVAADYVEGKNYSSRMQCRDEKACRRRARKAKR